MSAIRVAAAKSIETQNSSVEAGRVSLGRLGRNLGIIGAAALALAVVTPSTSLSQTPADSVRPRRPPMMARGEMLERFDADDDGQLNEAERAAARAWREASGLPMRPGFGPRGGPPGARPDSVRPEGRGRGGPPGSRPDSVRPEGRGRGSRPPRRQPAENTVDRRVNPREGRAGVALLGSAASNYRSNAPWFRLRRGSADAVRVATFTPAQAQALNALIVDYQNRVWQTQPVAVTVDSKIPQFMAVELALGEANAQLLGEYEARIWNVSAVSPAAESVTVANEVETSQFAEVLNHMIASYEQRVWGTNVPVAIPDITLPAADLPSTAAAETMNRLLADYEASVWQASMPTILPVQADLPSTAVAEEMNRLIAAYEASVWQPVLPTILPVQANIPVALNVTLSTAELFNRSVDDYVRRVWELEVRAETMALDVVNANF